MSVAVGGIEEELQTGNAIPVVRLRTVTHDCPAMKAYLRLVYGKADPGSGRYGFIELQSDTGGAEIDGGGQAVVIFPLGSGNPKFHRAWERPARRISTSVPVGWAGVLLTPCEQLGDGIRPKFAKFGRVHGLLQVASANAGN